MFHIALDEIAESHLDELVQNQTPESFRLEFKRELNLADRSEKAEAAKDVSAFANSAGGRLFYGIDETQLADGSTVASAICAISDGSVDSRLEDVLVSSIHPRPRIRMRKVSVAGGFVLVVEIYPSYVGDLHMVTGFREYRFYRRGEQRTILMTEPEIREAYARIAVSRQTLHAKIEADATHELSLVPATTVSALVIPWYGHRQLIDPRRFGTNLGQTLISGALRGNGFCHVASYLRVVNEGYRCHGPQEVPLNKCQLYMGIHRNGLVHFAEDGAATGQSRNGNLVIDPRSPLECPLGVLLVARYLLQEASYWGPVRVIVQLRIPNSFFITSPAERIEIIERTQPPIAPGTFEHVVPEVVLSELSGLKPVLVELLHQIYQTGGHVECPWFDAAGNLQSRMENFLSPHFLAHLA